MICGQGINQNIILRTVLEIIRLLNRLTHRVSSLSGIEYFHHQSQAKFHLTMIAIHWGTIDLSAEPLFEPGELFKKVTLEDKFNPKRLWVFKTGETRVLE